MEPREIESLFQACRARVIAFIRRPQNGASDGVQTRKVLIESQVRLSVFLLRHYKLCLIFALNDPEQVLPQNLLIVFIILSLLKSLLQWVHL